MHMSDGLITPVVGGIMLATSAGLIGHTARRIDYESLEQKVPYMGMVGAFVFASQMINFAIPGTGSSGHIGGGLLLAVLLGPYAGFLAMASILLVQAMFFADGGLLAYGCNLFNLGFFTCYLAYPYIYKPISESTIFSPRLRQITAIMLSTVIGLQLGALSVVIQTTLSGLTDLPFGVFASFMQPIHLAIGLVEGAVTVAVVLYLQENRKELIYSGTNRYGSIFSYQKGVRIFAVITLVVGVLLSQFASASPDGLEWSIENVSASALEESGTDSSALEDIQNKIAILPDYGFEKVHFSGYTGIIGTSLSGLTGSLITLLFVVAIGLTIRKTTEKKRIYGKARK